MFEDKATEWRIEELSEPLNEWWIMQWTFFELMKAMRVTLYSDIFAKQILPCYAAHAFNVFRKAMFQIEIVRLCALWDKAKLSLERETIPTVIELIDDPAVLNPRASRALIFCSCARRGCCESGSRC